MRHLSAAVAQSRRSADPAPAPSRDIEPLPPLTRRWHRLRADGTVAESARGIEWTSPVAAPAAPDPAR